MGKKLFVGNLSYSSTEDTLREAFEKIGAVVSAKIINDKFSGRSKGFGFVEMESDEDAQAAIEQLNGSEIDGRPVIVNEARPQQPRDGQGAGAPAAY